MEWYEALNKQDEILMERVMYGISCRNYEAASEAIPGAIGLSNSTVSRQFVAASAAQLRSFQERDMAGENIVALFLFSTSPAWLYCAMVWILLFCE
jgi:hypothetical protein